MKLIFVLSVFAIASIHPNDAFCNSVHQTSFVASSYKSHKVTTCYKSKTQNADLCMEERQSDETPSDSSRRLAMLRLTSLVSSAFLIPNRANADDEFEIFSEESDEIDEFLDDYEEEKALINYPSSSSTTPSTKSAFTADPWDKFTPKLTPNDGSGSALAQVQADTVNSSSAYVSPLPRQATKTKSLTSVTSPSKATTNKQELDTDHMDAGSFFALSFPVMVLGAAAYTFQKEKIIIDNASESHYTATGTPNVKIVMVENEPYGLDKGRRYYNGVSIIREFCDASQPKPSTECVNGIAGYLENVSSTGDVGYESQQTASAIMSYLDSLSVGGSKTINSNYAHSQATGVAFSSYLQGLSEGSVSAPPSPAASVAAYLDSLALGDNERISKLEVRMDKMQSDMNDNVARELNKIGTFLIEQRDCDGNINGSVVNNANGSQSQTVSNYGSGSVQSNRQPNQSWL